jgi:metal-responsive CopG/Arc/MetJ family transcriptional regulator
MLPTRVRRSSGGSEIHMADEVPVSPRSVIGYTSGMKTAISIPDKLFADAERLAARAKKSRSQLYAEAMREYLAHHDPEAITGAMNRLCKVIDTKPDGAFSAAARRVLERTEW